MNEKQRDGMERAGETGEQAFNRRATDELKTVRMAGEPYAKALKLRAGFDYEPGMAIKAVSYVDDINGEQVGRDDLWLATTDALNKLSGLAAAPVVAVVAADLATELRKISEDKDADALSYLRCQLRRAADEIDRLAALASQAQAAASAPTCDAAWAEYIGKRHPMLDTTHNRNLFAAGFAAQAAVGVESQQEQQPQPSCDAALRAAPGGQQGALVPMLLEHEIGGIMRKWQSESNSCYDLCRAVEAEVTRRFRAPGGNTNVCHEKGVL